MAVTSWMSRERTYRGGRLFSRHKSETEEDTVDLDASKDANENAFEILSNICKKHGLSDGKRLGYLNVFTKLIEQMGNSNEEFNISKEDMLCCLKVGIVSSNTLVRAGGLRVIRYFINTPDDVILLNKLQIPNLIARSIDLVLKNDHERIQAFRLALKILTLCPKYFSTAITRSLVSLANSINENKDRMSNSCLAILCQLCVLNPELLLECNGQTAILRSTLEISQARINECLVGCLLYLMNKPETRIKANIQLEYLTSIYCDWQRKMNKKEFNNIYTSSMLSILAALRTWTGVFHLCQPNNISGMKAIVDVLYLNQFEVRKAILELFYEIFELDHEDWTDEILVAIKNIDPSKYRDIWSLSEKFVAAEGKDILPHKAYYRVNLTEVHIALLVYSLIECGLLAALVEVIITTDAILSVQAIILLGFILHLSHKLLPPEIIELSPRLPTLVHYAANGLPKERTQALMAVSSLCRIHELLKNRPAPCSLFLHQLLTFSNWYKKMKNQNSNEEYLKQPKNLQKKSFRIQVKNIDDHIKESQVLISKDPKTWGWDHITTILKCQSDSFFKLEDLQHKNFIRKLMNFYKPSSNEYCNIKYNPKTQDNNTYTITSFALWNFLLQVEEGEPKKILIEFLIDLHVKLREIVTQSNIHEILFSPQQLNNTLCQHYFLMVGFLLSTENGERILKRYSILDTLKEIVTNSKHEFYVKLILSSLNYNSSCMARDILGKALTAVSDGVRMYATELLLILARSDVNNFSQWGLDLLVGQMYDENKVIATTSINILHELSYDQEYLESLINIRPSLLHLGDKGRLLLIRFLSTINGFVSLSDANFVENELENWEKEYNFRYVGFMEGDLHDSLTLYQRAEDEKYFRRFSNNKHRWKDVYVYPHLYGELSQHEKGFQALLQNGFVFKMIQTIHNAICNTDAEIMELKSSLWGVSNMATSVLGLQLLEQENTIQKIVNIAQSSSVLTIRATAFYCICLISTTIGGANALSKYGWYSVRHNRFEKWPVIQTEYLLMNEAYEMKGTEDLDSMSSATYESDEAEWMVLDNQFSKLSNDMRPSLLKAKKASTLPREVNYNFDENKFSKIAIDSQSMGDSENFTKSSGIPITRGNHQRSYSESLHRKKRLSSDASYDGSEVYQKLSFQDAIGLATLQSLHHYRRPDVISTINSELEQSEFRKSFSSQERMSNSPLSDFEAHNPPKLFSNMSSSSLSSLALKTPKQANTSKDSHVLNYSYRGISLPKTLSEFFVLSETMPDKKEDKKEFRKRGSYSFSEMEQVKELEEDVGTNEFLTTSSSDDSESDTPKERGRNMRESCKVRHNQMTCIACCNRAYKEKRQRNISNESYQTKTDTGSLNENTNENSPVQMKLKLKTQNESIISSFTCDSPFSNVDLRKDEEADGSRFTGMEPDYSSKTVKTPRTKKVSRNKIRRDVLKHINRMCNPVWAKASEQSLLQYKQSHPGIFEDPCLYSNVCDILANSVCRVTARRFIQELFLDVSFLKLFDDAAKILEKYTPNSSPIGDALISGSGLSSLPNLSPTERGDAEVELLSKSSLTKSKCTSPPKLTTLFESVPSPQMEKLKNKSRISITSNNLRIESSQIHFNYNSSEKVFNT